MIDLYPSCASIRNKINVHRNRKPQTNVIVDLRNKNSKRLAFTKANEKAVCTISCNNCKTPSLPSGGSRNFEKKKEGKRWAPPKKQLIPGLKS
jgi:hypothetical protein